MKFFIVYTVKIYNIQKQKKQKLPMDIDETGIYNVHVCSGYK